MQVKNTFIVSLKSEVLYEMFNGTYFMTKAGALVEISALKAKVLINAAQGKGMINE